jgi:hypothetical protein
MENEELAPEIEFAKAINAVPMFARSKRAKLRRTLLRHQKRLAGGTRGGVRAPLGEKRD